MLAVCIRFPVANSLLGVFKHVKIGLMSNKPVKHDLCWINANMLPHIYNTDLMNVLWIKGQSQDSAVLFYIALFQSSTQTTLPVNTKSLSKLEIEIAFGHFLSIAQCVAIPSWLNLRDGQHCTCKCKAIAALANTQQYVISLYDWKCGLQS